MSKTAILLVVLVAFIGVAIGFYTGFNPVTSIQTAIQNPSSLIEWIKGIPLTVWVAVGSAVGGITTAIIALARNVTQYKQQTQENLNQIRSDLTAQNVQLATQKQQAETQLTQTTQVYSEDLKTISTNYAKLQDHVADLETANKQVTAERDFYYNEAKKWEAQAKKPMQVP